MHCTSYVQCTHTRPVYGHYGRDRIGNTCACFWSDFIPVLLFVLNQKSSATITRQGKQTTAHTRMRDRTRRAAETAEQRQEKLTKWREMGLGTLPRLPMHPIVHYAYIHCNRNYHVLCNYINTRYNLVTLT